MKRHLTPLILSHSSPRRYDRQRLLKALDKLTEQEQADLFAILQDKTDEINTLKRSARQGWFR